MIVVNLKCRFPRKRIESPFKKKTQTQHLTMRQVYFFNEDRGWRSMGENKPKNGIANVNTPHLAVTRYTL